jgi:hypothetical protein
MSAMSYAVVLVYSTSHALKAEKAIKTHGVECKLIPVPRHLSSDCGVCVRIPAESVADITALLNTKRIEFDSIHVI